jgi:Rad3-related DNA helicase
MNYTVAVRTLCEFTAKAGDLDLRFTPAPTALQGMAGHALVRSRRDAGYRAEFPLSGRHGALTVRGRADGYDAANQRLEEIKTHRGDLAAMPGNHRHLHWAQLKVYGALLCQAQALPGLALSLVYLNVGNQQETAFTEHHSAASLQQFFEQLCQRFMAWAQQELAHRSARDASLGALAFPHGGFRTGQRELAEAVYRATKAGRCLMAQAPTGIGKTVGTLFPMLRAAPDLRLDKLFFLTAKGSGRQLALDALATLRGAGLPLRMLELTARSKACEHPDKACHGASCPLARGFYDRLGAARQDAIGCGSLDRETLRGVALRHAVCPYYLGQELARWADVVVGDYNHWFDRSALLHSLTVAEEWRVGVLVDEAHNLVERARTMYSAELDETAFRKLRRTAPASLHKAFDRLRRCWAALRRDQTSPYAVHAAVPAGLAEALQQAVAAINEQFDNPAAVAEPELLAFYFDALHFTRLLDSFGEHSLFDITLVPAAHGPGARLCLRNVVPAPFLRPRFDAAHSTTLFSATLSPEHFYRDMLGLPAGTAWADVASPFGPQQLAVRVAGHISTRLRHREASLLPIVNLLAAQYASEPGNYLAFFSSFEYLQAASACLAGQHPQVPQWQQSRGMRADERDAFLARFEPLGCGVGFAVLGGLFGEGIDLPGSRLIGAFVATLGLPPLNDVNQQMCERLAATFGAGYDYAYLYPGLQKVVQAAGRVIRTPQDRGVVVLIDDRFGRAEVRRLLPRWWGLDAAA